MVADGFSTIVPLYSYQSEVLLDRSRLKAWLKGRQIGGSFCGTLDVVTDAVETGSDWNMMSRSQRQAEKLLLKAAKHVKAYDLYSRATEGQPIVDPAEIGLRRIKLLNDATIEALPCDPDTTTGDTCNWLIDEFPLFPRSDEVFGVIKPSILHGKRMVILGTPRGRQHKFYDLYKKWQELGQGSGWSWHRTTIEDAVQGGLKLQDHDGNRLPYQTFRKQEILDIGTELYNQEYMCTFSDRLIAFLTWDLIRKSQSSNVSLIRSLDYLQHCGRKLYAGVDIGRRHDLTVIWVLSRAGDIFKTESVFVMDRVPFRKQEKFLGDLLKTKQVMGCCIDEQGIGMQLAENLQADFPGIVKPISPTNANKSEMANRIKIAMENGEFLMPVDDEVRDDFESIEKLVSSAGNVILSAPRSASGHGDRFWAAALGVHAACKCKPFELVMAVAG